MSVSGVVSSHIASVNEFPGERGAAPRAARAAGGKGLGLGLLPLNGQPSDVLRLRAALDLRGCNLVVRASDSGKPLARPEPGARDRNAAAQPGGGGLGELLHRLQANRSKAYAPSSRVPQEAQASLSPAGRAHPLTQG